jgi:hypothetical protein
MMLKTYFAMAILFGGVAWLSTTSMRQRDAQRQAVASQYKLGAQQMTVYDKCIGALEHKALTAGGSKQQFCGCFVQSGLSDLQRDESDAVLDWLKNGKVDRATVTYRHERALVAAITCSEDRRSKWTSVAELQSWCAERDERRKLPQCKLGLK